MSLIRELNLLLFCAISPSCKSESSRNLCLQFFTGEVPDLNLSRPRCGSCHLTGARPQFLAGDNIDNIWRNIRQAKSRILSQLGQKTMPPDYAEEHTRVWEENQGAIGNSLIEFVETVNEGEFNPTDILPNFD